MDQDEEEALKWIASIVLKYRKRRNAVKLVFLMSLVFVNIAFALAKVAHMIYSRGWLDAW